MTKRYIWLLFVFAVAACAGSTTPTNFYTLDYASDSSARGLTKLEIAAGTSIGVGPIDLPGLLDRPQIVTRGAGHNVEIAEYERWADGLEADLLRAMVRQLRQQLPTASLSQYPWPQFRKLDYQVRVVVLELEGVLGGDTVFSGNWSIANGEGEAELQSTAFSFRDKADGPTHQDLVVSYRRLATSLTNQIAIALEQQAGK
jgi:uncharacterized lipoprotein YmbA